MEVVASGGGVLEDDHEEVIMSTKYVDKIETYQNIGHTQQAQHHTT